MNALNLIFIHQHENYCKICGEYKANEKFSGKGHAAHICKACSRLSAAEKAEAMTMNRLYHFPLRRLTDNKKNGLKTASTIRGGRSLRWRWLALNGSTLLVGRK